MQGCVWRNGIVAIAYAERQELLSSDDAGRGRPKTDQARERALRAFMRGGAGWNAVDQPLALCKEQLVAPSLCLQQLLTFLTDTVLLERVLLSSPAPSTGCRCRCEVQVKLS